MGELELQLLSLRKECIGSNSVKEQVVSQKYYPL